MEGTGACRHCSTHAIRPAGGKAGGIGGVGGRVPAVQDAEEEERAGDDLRDVVMYGHFEGVLQQAPRWDLPGCAREHGLLEPALHPAGVVEEVDAQEQDFVDEDTARHEEDQVGAGYEREQGGVGARGGHKGVHQHDPDESLGQGVCDALFDYMGGILAWFCAGINERVLERQLRISTRLPWDVWDGHLWDLWDL